MNETNRSLSKKEYTIVSELSSRKINIITIEKASKIFKIEKKELWAILHRLEKKGWLERIEKGKYMVVPLHAKEGCPLWADRTTPYLCLRGDNRQKRKIRT